MAATEVRTMADVTLKAVSKAKSYVGTWTNTTTEALKRRRDRGQGSVEYLGVIILVGLIIVAIIATGVDDTIANALSAAVTKITSAGG
jgi:Flp pilus assembly pilin Flp